MIHYVLLKFSDSCQKEKIYESAIEAFSKLEQAIDGILSKQILVNCVERDMNADLMICLELASEDVLSEYLKHPYHRFFAEETDPYVERRVSFDHM